MTRAQIIGKGTYEGEEGIIVKVGGRQYIVYTDDEEFALEWAINKWKEEEAEAWDEFALETELGFY